MFIHTLILSSQSFFCQKAFTNKLLFSKKKSEILILFFHRVWIKPNFLKDKKWWHINLSIVFERISRKRREMEHGSRKSIKTLIDYLVHPFFHVILGIRSRLRMIILGDKTLKIVQNGFKVFMLFWVIDSMEVVYYDCSWFISRVHQSFPPFYSLKTKWLGISIHTIIIYQVVWYH